VLNRVIRFEVPTSDEERAARFFANVFGWQRKDRREGSGEIPLLETGPDKEMGINGSLYLKSRVPAENARFINMIEVDNIDSYIAKLKSHGAAILFGKATLSGGGYLAYFRDPDGNVMGIMQYDRATEQRGGASNA
jgi:predicted enzyme related to lactoylglutathione lyase